MSSNQTSAPDPIIGDTPGTPLPPLLDQWVEQLPTELDTIITTIAQAGGGVWVVGGAVRDALLGVETEDIDLAVSLEPSRMLELFPNAISTGIQYGTLTLRGADGGFYEATTLRTESMYEDGRRPEIVDFGTSLRGDLERRDFTFNAMAVDVRRRLLHDPYNGLRDLEQGRVKAVGQAYQRLAEDGLRILRAYRFLDRGEAGVWQFDHELAEALKQHRTMLSGVTNERIWMEWKKILHGQHAAEVVERMARDEVLDRFLPGQWRAQTHRFFAQRHPLAVGITGAERFALLLCENSSIEVINTLKNLKLSKKELQEIELIHRRFGRVPGHTKADLRVFRAVMQERSASHLNLEIVLRESGLNTGKMDDASTQYLETTLEELTHLAPLRAGNEPLIDGHWIMQRTGLAKGIALGRLKSWLHRLQIERDLGTEEEVEDVLCSLIWNQDDHANWPKVEF